MVNVGVRTLAKLLHLLVLQIDPVINEVFGEHTTFHEVVMISIERFQSTIQ